MTRPTDDPAVKKSLSMPSSLLDKAAKRARSLGYNLSGYVQHLLREDLLRQRPELTRLAIAESPFRPALPYRAVAHVTTDADGLITQINETFTKMCGYTLKELRGKKPGEVLQGPKTEKTIVREFHRAIQHAQPFECTLTNYHKSGAIYRVHIKMEPVFDAGGKLIQFKALEEKVE